MKTAIDRELSEARRRREQAIDLLVRALVEIDTMNARIDVLLDRRGARA